MEASALLGEANFRLKSLTQDVLGHSGQTVVQNEACLVSLESSPKMLFNDTKNTPIPFIDQKTFANEGEGFALEGDPGTFWGAPAKQ
ncbi:hypothetical protein R1flu_012357 [Riccia fluitans]|uniref:Uncharacterized protein n=1 Tax=Riccia fluitans TaxID=41844 RepID=A0ABD1ZAK4_9MARC